MSKIALVIIYNHQYNKNIEIVERIYSNRFSNIYHLVPFDTGEKNNVIPVYCSSIYFEGYVAQGLKSYFNEAYTHYFFVADDLILNPVINENNYTQHLKLDQQTCFVPRLSPLNESPNFWPVNFYAILYDGTSPGVEAVSQLPGYDEAIRLLKHHGIENGALHFNQVWKKPRTFKELKEKFTGEKMYIPRYIKSKITKKRHNLTYPLVRSYSDIFVVSSYAIKSFSHYCGVFAATQLFAELAIPTAMAFSAEQIVTEKELTLQGSALWTKEDMQQLDKYNNSLKNLLGDFPAGQLYLHPVKLSKWDTAI